MARAAPWAWSLAKGRRCCCPLPLAGGVPADGHGADLPVPGLAGVADGQPAPPPHVIVVVTFTAAFILIFQLPNLLNFFAPWHTVDAEAQAKQATATRSSTGPAGAGISR